MNASFWTELLKAIPTLIVGLIAARIAWQQAETAKQQKAIAEAKLKFDLFSKRLEFYEAVCSLAESAQHYKDHVEAKQAVVKMLYLAHQSSFLFGDDVEKLVNEMCMKVVDLSSGIKAAMDNNNVVSPEILTPVFAANTWIKNAPIKETFRPYLDLSSWR